MGLPSPALAGEIRRSWYAYTPSLLQMPTTLIIINLASISPMLDSMHTIKKISAQMLQEKIQDSAVAISDMEAKKDIMSLLVRARKGDAEKGGDEAISDKAMMDQVVSQSHLSRL